MKRPTNIIHTLRLLAPPRPLTLLEHERIAELQANRLREILEIDDALLTEDAIGGLPRLSVRRSFNLPVSGLTYWHSGRWIVALNADEPPSRQRFSLAHELKHIIDHPLQPILYGNTSLGREKAERVADYFAGCLLMPKRHVKRLIGQGHRARDVAARFDVSSRAPAFRLVQLGPSADIAGGLQAGHHGDASRRA